jgi:hypothetical protein
LVNRPYLKNQRKRHSDDGIEWIIVGQAHRLPAI